MIEENLQPNVQEKQATAPSAPLAAKRKSAITPARFSVNRLRRHPGIQKDRNPVVIR